MTAIQPFEMTRELRLKLALASLLPDDIEITNLVNFKWKRGRFAGTIVHDNEWYDAIRLIHNKPENLDLRIELALRSCGIEAE